MKWTPPAIFSIHTPNLLSFHLIFVTSYATVDIWLFWICPRWPLTNEMKLSFSLKLGWGVGVVGLVALLYIIVLLIRRGSGYALYYRLLLDFNCIFTYNLQGSFTGIRQQYDNTSKLYHISYMLYIYTTCIIWSIYDESHMKCAYSCFFFFFFFVCVWGGGGGGGGGGMGGPRRWC